MRIRAANIVRLLRGIAPKVNLVFRRDRGPLPRAVIGLIFTGPQRRMCMSAALYMPRPEQLLARQRPGFASGRLWLHLRVGMSRRVAPAPRPAATASQPGRGHRSAPLPGTPDLC